MIPEISRNKSFETLYLESALNVRAEMDNAADMVLLAAGKLLPQMLDGKLRFMNHTVFGSKIINPAGLRDLDMKMDQVVATIAMLVIELCDYHSESFDQKSFFIEMNLKWITNAEYRTRVTIAIPAQLKIDGDSKFESTISGEMIIISGDFKPHYHYSSMLESLSGLSDEIDRDTKAKAKVVRDPREEFKWSRTSPGPL